MTEVLRHTVSVTVSIPIVPDTAAVRAALGTPRVQARLEALCRDALVRGIAALDPTPRETAH